MERVQLKSALLSTHDSVSTISGNFPYSPEIVTSLRFSILGEVTLSSSPKTAISLTLSQHCWVCVQHDEPEKKGFLRRGCETH